MRSFYLLILFVMLSVPLESEAARIKDLADIRGVRDNQLIGYGLVVGLNSTGDYGQSEFTVQSVASMLSRMGIKVDRNRLQTRNVAAVMVTADLPPFARAGQRLDVNVASLGNARSLQGGTLIMTPLKGADGEVYAVAQGSLSVGGFEVRAPSGSAQAKNHVTAGNLPSGGIIERDVTIDLSTRESIQLILRTPDFATASEIANVISAFLGQPVQADANNPTLAQPNQGPAKAIDASTVSVTIPDGFRQNVPQFIGVLELLDVTPNQIARVVVNERTGTVVLGGDVRIREVAVAHGSLNVTINTDLYASQPSSFGQGDTQVVANATADVTEENRALQVVNQSASIQDVVSALNALGASPRDLISILQAIKAAGALDAELVIQ
ncbi:flagellar basal body P-ring protein FlgI [Microvenator marinus]|jgi:flagellar P-ring protein precursor FlgI|uniref:Flagellar P-ring protein n=1 Tax=Microvenator marinus TaxID=2600177 RepID=A0A5B8XYT2_9DELT|nr:flagellar basal body P-ring protein FlgI [Microvenator marinus]QED28609.1 flagellar basal body P-ring protein FlgI [Microvenator marinus]